VDQLINQLSELLSIDSRLLSLLLLLVVAGVVYLLLGLLQGRLHQLARRSVARWDDVILTALETPVRCALWVTVVYIAHQIYPLAPKLEEMFLRANDTILILLLTWFLQRLIRGVENEMLAPARGGGSSAERATVRSTSKLARMTLWIVMALMILQSIGVSIEGLLAFGGIGGIAVGFAAKDLLANFFGGISIYLDRPFTVGDWIRSPDKQIEGTVESIGWRLTVIRTFDQRPLYVPNAVFSQIAVENPSRMFNRRIYETIGLRYQDAGKVASVVNDVRDMLANHEAIDTRRTLIVNFVSFGPSSLDFFIYTFTKTTDWVEFHQIKEEVLLKVLEIVHRHEADVAFPTQTLQIDQIPVEPEA
jgi:MscS family membrane protein